MIVWKNLITSTQETKNFVHFLVVTVTMAASIKFMDKKKLESKNVHGTAIITKRDKLAIRTAKISIFTDIDLIYSSYFFNKIFLNTF